MPKSLPFQVLLSHMSKYLLQNALVWLRAALAMGVWIFWLPYFMRSVWSFMFWISDKGLVSHATTVANAWEGSLALQCPVSDAGSCPSTPLLMGENAAGIIAGAMVNGMANQSLMTLFKKMAMACVGLTYRPERQETSGPDIHTPLPSSLLSDVKFIKNLAGSGSSFHYAVVAVLEGQLITILVILTFILVILVRDYVIQQQPEINMRAAFPNGQPEADVNVNENPQPAENNDNQAEESESDEEASVAATAEDVANTQPSISAQYADSERPAVAGIITDPTEAEVSHTAQVQEQSLVDREILPQSETDLGSSSIAQADEPRSESSIPEFLRIFREAEGDPERILQMIYDQGSEVKLSYWVERTKKALEARTEAEQAAAQEDMHPFTLPNLKPVPEDADSSSGDIPTPTTSADDTPEVSIDEPSSSAKGKEKEVNITPLGLEPSTGGRSLYSTSDASRPRSKSDGYQSGPALNPLANNSWSFNAIPENDSEPQPYPMDRAASSDTFQEEEFSDRPTSPVMPQSHEGEQEPLDQIQAHPVPEVEVAPVADRPEAAQEAAPEGFMGRVVNFMWGDIAAVPVGDLGNNDEGGAAAGAAPEDEGWMDIPGVQGLNDIIENELDGLPLDGAEGGADPEVVDELDDFDGIMELIGMRGPLAGLFQNAIFCAVLVSATILSCTFFPYNIGRISLWILANPMRLFRMVFEASKFVQDFSMCIGAFISWCALNILDMVVQPFSRSLFEYVVSTRKGSWSLWVRSVNRVISYVYMDLPAPATEIQNFSAISHHALNTIKATIYGVLISGPLELVRTCFTHPSQIVPQIISGLQTLHNALMTAADVLLKPNSWVMDLGEPEKIDSIDPLLANWSAIDRFWAILAGYLTIFVLGALYLKRGSPFTRGNMMEAWEAGVIETLHQASGIMKVILIISIEMLVFPLYCGLLLDVALLPLFEGATLTSRVFFTYNFPLTSVFVHWFVGTGYMFHFALFVSMCRKIMRAGVLCEFSFPCLVLNLIKANSCEDFIRDPDDPEFHPVRDVLERNLMTQLRKILFSAFVYGALVVLCLGGVVWGLAFAVPNVLPIHYSSNEPVLEFPVDLLFYNFLMPLAVNFLKPSDGLHTMYTWWFRRCARALRLTYFLFGERRIDEEGTLQLPKGSKYATASAFRKAFLEINDDNEVVPSTFTGTFDAETDKANSLRGKRMRLLRHKKSHLVKTGQLVKSGEFVRAPASDRVKVTKGKRVFLPVTERDHRKDGKPDDGSYAPEQYKPVYIPPHFRARIFAFITMIWVFAAVTGVGFTIVPLVLGRRIFKLFIPDYIRTNDIYAFSIGFYLLGSIGYAVFHMRQLWLSAQIYIAEHKNKVSQVQIIRRVGSVTATITKLIYSYFFLAIVFPLLASALVELYFLLPLNTYLHPPTAGETDSGDQPERHTVRIVQVWTLGLLYIKLGTATITSLRPGSRIATAVQGVMRNGWLRPDASILTRAFILPGLAVSLAAIIGPHMVTTLLIQNGYICSGLASQEAGVANAQIALAYRKAYPIALAAAIAVRYMMFIVGIFHGWTARIRDEAYLIGERLHNFGAGPARRGVGAQAFRAGGPRL